MNGSEFIRSAVRELNRALLNEILPLDKEELIWQPTPDANPIGPLFFHTGRSQDGVIHRMQNITNVWEAESWGEKFSLNSQLKVPLDESDLGLFDTVRLDDLICYFQRVAEATESYMESLTDEELDRIPIPAFPRRTVGIFFRSFILGHGWWHYGEIKYLKGMQGIRQDI